MNIDKISTSFRIFAGLCGLVPPVDALEQGGPFRRASWSHRAALWYVDSFHEYFSYRAFSVGCWCVASLQYVDLASLWIVSGTMLRDVHFASLWVADVTMPRSVVFAVSLSLCHNAMGCEVCIAVGCWCRFAAGCRFGIAVDCEWHNAAGRAFCIAVGCGRHNAVGCGFCITVGCVWFVVFVIVVFLLLVD